MKRQRPHPVVVTEQCLEKRASGVPQTYRFIAAARCYEFGGGGWGRGLFEPGDDRKVWVGSGWGEDAAFDNVFVTEEGGLVFGR